MTSGSLLQVLGAMMHYGIQFFVLKNGPLKGKP